MARKFFLVRALYSFEATSKDELSFQKEDLMEVDEAIPETDNWWPAVHCKTKETGLIPCNYVIKDDMSPETQDWWFDYDRKEADKMLLFPGNHQGTFLVRTATDKSSYVLSVHDKDQANGEPCIRHYRIRRMDDGNFFITAWKTFPSLIDVINYYKENLDGLCCKLTVPCPRIKPVVQLRDVEISRDLVKLTHRLGSGSFGKVSKGTLSKVGEVAVKTLKSGAMSSEAFLDEARIMHKLTHPRIVQLLAVVSVSEPFYIITELMVHGALLDFLRTDDGKKLMINDIIDINSQIAEGMAYLESKKFVHRDLRAANILVGEHCDVKVADFGLARMLDSDYYKANEKTRFPLKWTAPEAAFKKKFSVKSDVWSFGVLMYEIITFGMVPYPDMTNSEVLEMLSKGGRMSKPTNGPMEVSDAYFKQMLRCWNQMPGERPTFIGLKHFFDDYFTYNEPFCVDMN